MKVLAVLYFVGGILHVMDIFDLRLKFSEMDSVWKIWIVYLCAFDLMASIGLWKTRAWGVYLFLLIPASQLIAYIAFKSFFGEQRELVLFHILTLTMFFVLIALQKLWRHKNVDA